MIRSRPSDWKWLGEIADVTDAGGGVPAGALTISNNSGWTYTPFPPPPRVKDLSPWNYDYSNFSPFFFFDFNIGYSHWHRTVTYDDGTTSTEPGCWWRYPERERRAGFSA